MNAMIETENLTRKFGSTEAVHDLCLRVPEGSIYAFLGPNGAGKTTTIKMLMNIIRPSGGTARLLGVDSKKLSPKEWQKIGYVSENQQLPEWMTVRQLINYCQPLYPSWDPALCEKLRKDFDLPLERQLKEFSRGMKVKAALLTSLAYRPQLLVLDEPFTGLDPLVRDEFVRGVLELSEQEKWTVFISSHDIEEVERLADFIGIINGGRLHLQESTEELQARYRQVEVILDQPWDRIPPDWPAEWLGAEVNGNMLRFVESHFTTPEKTETALKAFRPGAATFHFLPLSLRNIFLVLARNFRSKPSNHF
jgi:ABC-2 type transport system ATP-binding protein